ncbi:MAG: hypothetical protein ACR2IF_09145 [Terriglobales bacterium]
MQRRTCTLLVLLLWILASSAVAQTAAQPSSEDDRIKALEDRIIALEGQVRLLKEQQATQPASNQAASPATGAASASAAPPQSAAAPVGGSELSGQLPVYGGASAAAKALNPDVSVIGDFLGTMGHNSVAPVPALEMHEAELGLQAIIDPYARGDFFISFGEQGVNLEEGYITYTALPAGFVLRGGKMRAAFGKVNSLHNHVLPWTDRPLVTGNLVGGEDGINDAGLSLTRILPAPKGIFLEGTGQVFRGDSADVFTSRQHSDVSAVAHLRGYRDITESTNLDLGISYARGHNDAGGVAVPPALVPADFITQLYGVDATVRWKPLRRAIYHSFVGRSEFIWSQRQQLPSVQRAFGFYTSGDFQLGRRWFVGARYDRSDRARDDALTDRGGALVLTYWPSEFSQIRSEYRYVKYAEGLTGNELRFQLQFSLGAHGAHPF